MSSEHPSSELGRRLLAAARQDTSWVIRFQDDSERTLTTSEVVDAYNERLIDPRTYVWTDGMQTWQELQTVDAIVEALHAEAARHADQPPTRDPSKPAGANGSACQDDSTMFSLAMLVHDNEPGAPRERSDDSGLIDLGALAAAAQDPIPAASPPLGLFPLEAAAPSHRSPAPAEARSRGIVGGLLAAVVMLSALLVVQVARRGAGAVVPPSSATTPAEAKPAVTSVTITPATRAPQGVAGSAEAPPASVPAEAKQVAPPPRPTTAPLPTTRPTVKRPPVASPATTPTATAKANPCRKDDLDCNMRWATRR